jgi:hypothetical protein
MIESIIPSWGQYSRLDIEVLYVRPENMGLPPGQQLRGYRGPNYMDSGYFYCPYLPLTQTPVVLDPETFEPRRAIRT